MSARPFFSANLKVSRAPGYASPPIGRVAPDAESDRTLPAAITRAASAQTYLTIRTLVDRDRVLDAFRAYAYFRWVDDSVDQTVSARPERIAFVKRQQALLNACYGGAPPRDLSAEERLLADLVRGNRADAGLKVYLRSMMAVMAFDAGRRGRLISEAELTGYTGALATAVTEAMHTFIGHDQPSPRTDARYLAVTGAHVTHLLRDTAEDVAAGYFNVPREVLEAHGIGPGDLDSAAYRAWVQSRVQLARACFAAGKKNLAQVENWRCRIAGYAYTARFEATLDAIERADYRLRAFDAGGASWAAGLKMAWAALAQTLCVEPI